MASQRGVLGAVAAVSVGAFRDHGNYCRRLNLVQQTDMKETKLQNVEQLTTGVLNKESFLVDVKAVSAHRLETWTTVR